MKIEKYPSQQILQTVLQRPSFDASHLQQKVLAVLEAVKKEGDIAVRKFTKEFDGVDADHFLVSETEIKEATSALPVTLKQAIETAAANITKFHKNQFQKPEVIETMPGVSCWRKSVGIEKVGLYIPGGTAPLFSTILMLAIPANIAGCKEIILCSPPDKQGGLHPAILFAAKLTGITKIFKAGGVQAIAAMAYGTQSISRVYKIFGPGNQYVTCAKQMVQQQGIAIDMPAGPSEVCVLADASANPSFIAADLLSQAEHGPDSQVLLVSVNEKIALQTQQEVAAQLGLLPRQSIAQQALENSNIIIVKTMDEAVDIVNQYAAEHLILACENAPAIAERIINAGSVFIGNYSPESVGDYASGTNHTLPTNGYAHAYSGVSVDSFVKKITYQQLTKEGLKNIAGTVQLMAEAEGLQAHSNAVSIRLQE